MPALNILAYHVGFRCDGVQLGATTTGPDGAYVVEYQRDGVVNLQIRAADERGTQAALSQPKYRAGEKEVINLVCPSSVRAARSEHERLLADLAVHVGREDLGEARQDGDCRDISMLAGSTGWDGRVVALAAHAERLSRETGVPGDVLYALLRTGLPANARQLASVPASTLDHAFAKANAAGVANVSAAQIASAKSALAELARTLRLGSTAAAGTLSTVGELLASSGLTEQEARRFDEIAVAYEGEAIWEQSRLAGFSAQKISQLQTQGKLAALTLNNAQLITRLQQDIARDGMARTFMAKDFHKAASWQAYLMGMPGWQELIPPAYSGRDAEERLAVYAEDLARKVRLSLPTYVVARRAESGEFSLPATSSAAQVLYRAAEELDFSFATTPTRTFLKQNTQLFEGVANAKAVEETLVALHRVYQITPGDEAMKVMIDEGLTSAHMVTSMDKTMFSIKYGDALGGRKVADAIHNKSVLVSSVAYNAFAAAQQLGSSPVVYAVSPPADVIAQAQENIVKHFPTMEHLFGELDFCECDHCRSVLSPAAYLVDLLSFVDPADNVWELIRKWPNEPKPYAVLTGRRPDLPQLPLTCENTHTVLPYIDVVNEILEFSVAHQGDDLPAFDVGLAESEDLLAEPQNLITEAYPALAAATYPLGLPFDLHLETVRAFLERLDAPLPGLLAQLCSASDLDGVPYGWRAVYREQLGVSPSEYALFVNGTTDWHKLYGYADAGTARTALTQAKTLANRLGVSYKELADLVKSWFVNPHLDALALLRSLGLESLDLMRYMGASGVPPFDLQEKAAFEEKAGSHLSWLTTQYNQGTFDTIVVLADSDTSCSFEHTTIRFLKSSDPIDEVLTRINLLVRLKRAMAWKLSELDAALRAFLPAGALGPALATALLSLAHHKTLAGQVKLGSDTRIALLSLWSTIDSARYRKLFLSPRMRPEDKAVFDDPHGNYLSNPAIALKDHLPAVQGALGITADEAKLVLGNGFDSAMLSLATVSLLDRHRVLAKGLKLSVADLLALKELCGVDPFRAAGVTIAALADDAGYDTLRFTEIAAAVKKAGLKVAELDFLVRNAFDPAGPLAPSPEKVLGLIRALAGEIGRIRTEHAVPADGLTFTDEIIAQKLPLVLPAEISAKFLGMWAGTVAADQSFFDTHLLAPVGFASPADFAVLFAAALSGDAEVQEAWQRNRRAHLASLFLPFLQDRLIQTMITAMLAGEFDAADDLTAALLTQLLEFDGGPLLPVYRDAAVTGLTVTYRSATDTVLGTALSTDGSAPAGPGGTAAVKLAGFFEVPTPGPYGFAAASGAMLKLGHLTDPLAANPDGTFEAVTLQPGTIYELAVTIPGAGPAELKVVAENMPLGPAGRLTARPAAVVERISAVYLLMRKVFLLAGKLELSLKELQHLHSRPADFAGWDLSAPTFEAMLRVCAMVLLRGELKAGGAELIDIFRQARRTPEPTETAADVRGDVLERIATLTRRTPETVSEAADALALADAADFADERGLGRLWRLLALAKTLGVAPSSVVSWANPAPGEALAAHVRTTLKARFEPSAWRATVKPVSDRLRQLRRDALVRYLMHRDGYASLEELFEHFLVDPGTEPVVQTSRLRLAISSLQTFIQRCLMNLEPMVRPAALSSTQWAWMKRYRVWEANRKIFLWPENWLEPEFRDDKSHLFQALEGELLQGDISQDLAEDTLVKYLSGLDKIARLEIVSTWLQEHETDPAHNTLHVIGRTYNKPSEHFYRRYQHQAWTPWEPVGAQIESDHLVVTIWRGRPYLFWLTFVDRSEPGDFSGMSVPTPTRIVDVQLSWAEYVNGQWAAAEASDLNRPLTAKVADDFDRREVFVHAETHLTEEEDQVLIYLSKGGEKHQPAEEGNMTQAWLPAFYFGGTDPTIYRGFRLVGRNAPVEILSYPSWPMSPPFTWNGIRGTQYAGSGPLTVWYTSRIEKFAGETTEEKATKKVLDKGNNFALVIPPGPVNTTGKPEIDSLVRPFFYQDARHTFYVEPTVTEQTFHKWEDWILVEPGGPSFHFDNDLYWEEIDIDPIGPVINPADPISEYAIYAVQNPVMSNDAVLSANIGVHFGDSIITAGGAIQNG
jgi:hypothetical protein